ncbi:hypothetical protein BH23ACT5_BH23ACT5_12380 [soil metagenome]
MQIEDGGADCGVRPETEAHRRLGVVRTPLGCESEIAIHAQQRSTAAAGIDPELGGYLSQW